MPEIPKDLLYANSHEWVRIEAAEKATIGFIDYAQNVLGDTTFAQLPEVGDSISETQPFGVIESVKAASELYAPVSGRVLAVNERLAKMPDLVTSGPYEGGWLLKIALFRSPTGPLTPEEYLNRTRSG